MKPVLKVVQRSLVIEFYRQNAAFFGLILLVFFGFVKSSEHVAIGTFLVGNADSLFFLYVLWIAYVVKVALFLLPAIHKPENQFLESFILLSRKTRIAAIASLSFSLLIPVVAYAAFLAFLAVSGGFFISLLSILICVITLLTLMTFLILHRLNGLPHERKIFQLRFFRKIPIPAPLFFVSYLLRHEIVLLFLTKLYSCLLIAGASALYRTDDFDLRLFTTGVLLASVGNVAILHKYVWFQYQPLAFSLNLPFGFAKIFRGQLTTVLIILIPEITVIFRHFPLIPDTLDILGILLFALGLCHLMYALMLRKQVELSDFLIVIFWLVVLSTFTILFSVHPAILGIIFLAISMTIAYIHHYQYEHSE